MPPPVNIAVSSAVARALDALALPGEARPETVARLVWACGTAKVREQDSRNEQSGPAGGCYARYVKNSEERKP